MVNFDVSLYYSAMCNSYVTSFVFLGLQNGKIVGPKHFAPPPPSRQGKAFCTHPPSLWLKLQAPVLKLPQNFLCPPSAWLKRFPPSVLAGVNLTCPPSHFVAPLPVISDQSLISALVISLLLVKQISCSIQ